MKDYKKILEGVANIINNTEKSDIGFANICAYIGENCPELKESEDERIRKHLIKHFRNKSKEDWNGVPVKSVLAWLEKQGEQKQDPCEHCKDKCPNCHNFSCIEKITLEQGKKALEAIKEEKVDNANKVEPKDYSSIDPNFGKPIEQNPAWSEEDEMYIRELESLVKQVWATAEHENDKDTIHKMSDLSFFLKTLKPQPKQEWSEEDEEFLRRTINAAKDTYPITTNWLKSIKDRYTWKPTEAQMASLQYIYRDLNPSLFDKLGWDSLKILESLYNDLKKLREE